MLEQSKYGPSPQCVRSILFRRLLQAFPHRKKAIWGEALVDVAPLYRPHIWASLLNIPSNVAALYAATDKEWWNPVDRQRWKSPAHTSTASSSPPLRATGS